MKRINKRLLTIMLGLGISISNFTSVCATEILQTPKIPNNSLVIGDHLIELDNIQSEKYNLQLLNDAYKTTKEDNNLIFYKFNNMWYTGKDIKSFTTLIKAKGVDNINNNIENINGVSIKDAIGSAEISIDTTKKPNTVIIKVNKNINKYSDINVLVINKENGSIEHVDNKYSEDSTCKFELKLKKGTYYSLVNIDGIATYESKPFVIE